MIDLNRPEVRVNFHSQWGEDGIIEAILDQLPPKPDRQICIEVGANDGLNCSNTAHLWRNGWHALLIEKDRELFELLELNTRAYPKVTALHEAAGEKTLDEIVMPLLGFQNPYLISVDVDGDDYYIVGASELKPIVWIVEFNPTLPLHSCYIQTRGDRMGCSAESLRLLMAPREYHLVAITDSNMIFVRGSKADLFRRVLPATDDHPAKKYQTRAISDYKGNFVVPGRDSQEPTWGCSGKTREL